MNTIKQFVLKRFKSLSLLTVSMLFSIILLMIRMKITHSFFYLFLVWNLFLAVVPFALTTYLVSLLKLNKFVFGFWFSVWLLFLPNAPYIITDLLHLKISTTHLLWLDILVVLSFALNGLLLFYLSVSDMQKLLRTFINKKGVNYLLIVIPFLSGFGVYLGRFLRYNSWEVISNPKILFVDIINIVIKPFINQEAWLFTLLFGTFLGIGFWMFKQLSKN